MARARDASRRHVTNMYSDMTGSQARWQNVVDGRLDRAFRVSCVIGDQKEAVIGGSGDERKSEHGQCGKWQEERRD